MSNPLENGAQNGPGNEMASGLLRSGILSDNRDAAGGISDPEIFFHEWQFLAEVDPEAFELRRKQVIETVLDQLPEQQRTRCIALQCKIDAARHDAENPQMALAIIGTMMVDHLQRLGDSLCELSLVMQALKKHPD